METGKGGRGWEEEERAGQMVWASHTAGGRRESEEELVAGNGRGGRRVEEVFIKLGSQLRLICHLRRATSKPTFLFWCHLISAIFTTSYQPFSHHQGSVDFNTVNAISHLIHPWGWINENGRTLPQVGMYWVVHPLQPQDFPRPLRKTHHKVNTYLLMLREWLYIASSQDALGNTSPSDLRQFLGPRGAKSLPSRNILVLVGFSAVCGFILNHLILTAGTTMTQW